MSSNSVCNHTRDKQIGPPLRGRPILLSLVLLQTELDSTQSYYHYLLEKETSEKVILIANVGIYRESQISFDKSTFGLYH